MQNCNHIITQVDLLEKIKLLRDQAEDLVASAEKDAEKVEEVGYIKGIDRGRAIAHQVWKDEFDRIIEDYESTCPVCSVELSDTQHHVRNKCQEAMAI